MGLFSSLVMLPLAPLTGLVWLARQLEEIADQEMNDPVALRRRLTEAEEAHAAGLIGDIELEAIEEAIVHRLLQNSGALGGMR
jgi:hypothetical protein